MLSIAIDINYRDTLEYLAKNLEGKFNVIREPEVNVDYDYYLGHGDAFLHRGGQPLTTQKYNKLIGYSHDLDWGPTPRCKLLKGWLLPSQLKYDDYSKYVGADKCRLVGWTKSDILFRPEKEDIIRETKKELNLNNNKTVLYAPSSTCFRGEGIATHPTNVDSLLEQFRDKDMNLIIKEHIHWEGVHQKERMDAQNKAKTMENVRWLPTGYPLMPLFLVSDVLLTWRFCCVFKEFMLKGPVVELLPRPKERERVSLYNDTDQYKVPLWFTSLKGDTEYIMPLLERAIDKPDEYKEQRDRMVARYFYKPDGHATERAVEAIKDFTE